MLDHNVVWHAKGREMIEKEIFQILYEYASNTNRQFNRIPQPVAKIKPSQTFILKCPEWSKLPSNKTLQIWNDASIIRECFNLNLAQYQNNQLKCVAPDGAGRWEKREYRHVISVSGCSMFVHHCEGDYLLDY